MSPSQAQLAPAVTRPAPTTLALSHFVDEFGDSRTLVLSPPHRTRKGKPQRTPRELVVDALRQLPTIETKTAERLVSRFGEEMLVAMLADNVFEFINLMDDRANVRGSLGPAAMAFRRDHGVVKEIYREAAVHDHRTAKAGRSATVLKRRRVSLSRSHRIRGHD